MTHYLVTGASGLLGLNFALAVDGKKHQVTGVANTLPMNWASFENIQAELTEPGIVEKLINEVKPEVILHCAAIANMDACEADPSLARRVNAELPGVIAEACSHHSIHMIHISTDAVFDGKKGEYTEDEQPNPLSMYAYTKWEGEQAVISVNPAATVVRVNFYGWSAPGNRSLAEVFVHNLEAGKSMMGFTDVLFSPLNVNDLSSLLLEIAELHLEGIFHVVGAESMSKHQFGTRIAEVFGFEPSLIHPVSINESGLQASRSPNLTLSTKKLVESLGHPLPDFTAGLHKFHDQYQRGYPQYIHSLA